MNRRAFLKTSASTIALAGFASRAFPASQPLLEAAALKARPLKKGIIWWTVNLKDSVAGKMRAIKEAGFDGVEVMSHMNQDEVLRARDETGLAIPSVCGARHWKSPLSDPDSKVRAEGLEALKQALRDAKCYGASSVLLVPALVTKEVSYPDAYARSQEEIRKAIPLAEEFGVKIAIENVPNHFLLSPIEAARYVDEFKSPAVGWHFDVGNILDSGWPDQWIRILGRRLLQLHIKEFSSQKCYSEGLPKAFDVPLLEGDIDWPAVMKAVGDIGYSGWGIAEQVGANSLEGLKHISQRMSTIFSS